MPKLNLEGQRFGNLTVLSYSHETKDKSNRKQFYWNCLCDCGKEKKIRQHDLIYGATKSCGCLKHGANLTGKKYGRWTVVKETESIPRKDHAGVKKAWLCQCECGNQKIVIQDLLLSGHSKSCGCLIKDTMKSLRSKPDSIRKKYSRLYKIYLSMRARCNNPNDIHHKSYHDRGISICEEWSTFEPFLEWALNNGYQDYLTIDRINVNGNYEPSNCRWATNSEQQHNKQNTRYYEIFGEIYRSDEIEGTFNIKRSTFLARVNRYGFTPEEAVTIPTRHRHKKTNKECHG